MENIIKVDINDNELGEIEKLEDKSKIKNWIVSKSVIGVIFFNILFLMLFHFASLYVCGVIFIFN